MRIAPTLALAASLAACAHRPPPPLGTVRLDVERAGDGLRAFVRAKVAGRPVRLLVDTGAYQSILPAGLARAQALRTGSDALADLVVDANGRTARMHTLPGVPVQFEGEAAAGALDFLMSPSAATDEGILAPQDLVRRGGALVIDLERAELSHVPEEAALARLRERGEALRELDFGKCPDENLFERSHRVVEVAVNGVRSRMLVDTGAEQTMLARNHPALGSMAAMEGDRTASFGVTSVGDGLALEGVPVVFSGTPFVVSAVVLPASSTCGHGALGADVLRHCTLVWGWSRLWVACRAPGPSE